MSTLEEVRLDETTDLLYTKIAPPRLHTPFVARDDLLDRLDAALDHKLTLISAPAGYGKTTLVSAWMARRSEHPEPLSIAWVALDAGDNDPLRFWRYVLSACRRFVPDIGATALEYLRTVPEPSYEAALTALINDFARCAGRFVLVLEDYHVINTTQIHEQITLLLNHLPPSLHLMIISRSDPPLPLARMRVHNELCEVRSPDLRFSLTETAAFLQAALPCSLSPEAVLRLDSRTEGWVAGLRLITLALQHQQHPQVLEQVLTTITGDHRHIMEYLVADVLAAQPPALQTFLLETSVLGRLSASLCDAITGRDDSAAMLAEIERRNLFLVPLDAAQQWYRFHDLFAEAMAREARRRLGDAHLGSLSLAASYWYEAHGLITEAVETALTARAYGRAATLIEGIGSTQDTYHELWTSRRWLEQAPEAVLRAHPTLCLRLAQAILFTSDRKAPATWKRVEQPLVLAEQTWSAAGDRASLGVLSAFRSLLRMWQGKHVESALLARQSLDLLPEGEVHWRGISQIQVGVADLYAGKLHAARRTLLQARDNCATSRNQHSLLAATVVLGDLCAAQGDLHQAAHLYREVLDGVVEIKISSHLPKKGTALLGLAYLAYEWNDLAIAAEQAREAVAIGNECGQDEIVVRGKRILAHIALAQGATEQAQRQMHMLTAQTKHPLLVRELQCSAARMALMNGDLHSVERWHAALLPAHEGVPRPMLEQEAMLVARFLVARGKPAEALQSLEGWRSEAREEGRLRSEIELAMLSALAYQAWGNIQQAGAMLSWALESAQFQGFQRVFLDDGAPLVTLLRSLIPALRSHSLQNYARTLSGDEPATILQPAQPDHTSSSASVETLSRQEQRVLALLASGHSNPEMAETLIVSINTIKTQLKSIYRKLNVSNRTQASNIARRMNLI